MFDTITLTESELKELLFHAYVRGVDECERGLSPTDPEYSTACRKAVNDILEGKNKSTPVSPSLHIQTFGRSDRHRTFGGITADDSPGLCIDNLPDWMTGRNQKPLSAEDQAVLTEYHEKIRLNSQKSFMHYVQRCLPDGYSIVGPDGEKL